MLTTRIISDKNLTKSTVVVMGIGGCGCNIVRHMANASRNEVTQTTKDIRFVLANTDAQALKQNDGNTCLKLGANVTKLLGAQANPDLGRQAAEESQDAIVATLRDASGVFLVAGMGGGTGTGATPVVAEIAKTLHIPIFAILTQPFPFEGSKRAATACKGIEQLDKNAVTLVIIPNEMMLTQPPRDTSLLQAFKSQAEFAWKIVQAGCLLVGNASERSR